MKRITIFTWGYWGWGNATKHFVKAVDAVEESRGFKPPLFVDIRLSRSVRAPGFNGNAFEKTVGTDRYRWMKSLGNESIVSKSKKIKIADPSAAKELLDFAVAAAKENRRVIFYCACEAPKHCHRSTVARLVVNAAKKKRVPLEIGDWPGGKPGHIEVEVPLGDFRSIAKGKMSISLGKHIELSEIGGLAWGTTATVHSNGERVHRLVGPAKFQGGKWTLPVFCRFDEDEEAPLSDYKTLSARMRTEYGYDSLTS